MKGDYGPERLSRDPEEALEMEEDPSIISPMRCLQLDSPRNQVETVSSAVLTVSSAILTVSSAVETVPSAAVLYSCRFWIRDTRAGTPIENTAMT